MRVLTFYSRRELNWVRPGTVHAGFPESIWFILLQVLVVWRTTRLLNGDGSWELLGSRG